MPIRFNGKTLDTWAWGSGPRVLLVHGWGGIAAHLAGWIAPVVSAGFEVVAFDGPAHGGAPGKRTNLIQFSDCILQIERESPHGLKAVLGHSFGASALMVALHRGLRAEAAVLISPFSSSDRNIEAFAKFFQLPSRLTAATRERLLSLFDQHLYVWDLALLAADFCVPVLLVHDAMDREVPLSESRAIDDKWPGARLHTTKGLGHHLIVRDQAVIRETTQFLALQLAPASARSDARPAEDAATEYSKAVGMGSP